MNSSLNEAGVCSAAPVPSRTVPEHECKWGLRSESEKKDRPCGLCLGTIGPRASGKGKFGMALYPYLPAEVRLELAKAFFIDFSPRYRCFFKTLGDRCQRQEQRRRGDDRLQLPPTSLPLPSETHSSVFLPVWERSLSHAKASFV